MIDIPDFIAEIIYNINMKIIFESIGVIHSPFAELENMPIQPSGSLDVEGTIEIYPKFSQGLQDLDGFSHMYAIYYFHKVKNWKPIVTPFLDDQERGLFSTRAPKRPNPIGISLMEIIGIDNNIIKVQNIDILDDTPLLDIKPYVPQFEPAENIRIGWLSDKIRNVENKKSDKRFIDK